jgi:preprotein translocase subunit SecY
MKKFLQTIQNIWSIQELRSKIINTLGFLLIYRIGSFVMLPGIDAAALASSKSGSTGGLLDLINMFSGGAFSNASIFALGIMPYISASIVVQLMGIAVPYLQKLQREGESGRRKVNQITRYLTIAITALQAPGYIGSQIPANAIMVDPTFFWISSIVILVAGTMFVMWLGEKITDKGLGNGISLIIMIGIIANLPGAFIQEFASRLGMGGGPVIFLLELVVWLGVIVLSILLVQGTRRIPVQFAKRIVGNRQYGGVRQYVPLKVNAAGVMPIIFAQAIMFVPIMFITQFSEDTASLFQSFTDFRSWQYNVSFALMIIIFTYFYTAITVNPKQMADDMKRNGGFIPGVKPGKKTAEFLDNVLSRITLPGSFFLAFVAILPAIAMLLGVNTGFAQFYGGTSLLILVGVVLDTLQQVESHLLMRQYDGLMKNHKIKGRGPALGAAV